ncbi:hypothetical protein [Brevibacillus brevis]|nr:hypothetical protein [Brevibacillus brevis]GEC90624.1 hypothetical protein BBR01nite_29550 [Brevibacillus brevis]
MATRVSYPAERSNGAPLYQEQNAGESMVRWDRNGRGTVPKDLSIIG